MGVAAMVIGIVAAILGFVPCLDYFALIPAIIGLVLGISDVVQKSKIKQPIGQGVAGIILNAIAILIILTWVSTLAHMLGIR